MGFGVPTRHIRILVQWGMFLLWAALILATRHPMESWIAENLPISLFLRIDPLVMTVVSGGMRMAVTITLLGLVTLGVSLLLGRVFCGWVCPLGSIFDAYGWILRKLRVKFEGPSPSWFRFKYYLLFSLLIFAALGAVSPLMGFDPIVLLTRVGASVINPFFLNADQLTWSVDGKPGNYGYFIDVLTLILFLTIMVGTTKVSRIWCRTACPLGAYLAITSRNAILRRETKGCVHCNICSNHCPTGAINFQNAEIYNESECIKCFACSQECPVDANYFTYKSPFKGIVDSHHPVSLERRKLIGTAAFTVLAAPTLQLAAGDPIAHKTLLRPPMSREERDFLASCIRCDNCVKACPTGVLKPAKLEHGLRALWSPVMVPTEGYCKEGCNACSEACPTDAIMKYPVEKKYQFKAGTAIFETSRCISYVDNKYCSECIRACPTDAIEFIKEWEPPGAEKGQAAEMPAPPGQRPTRPTHIVYEKCVGCGACEYECNLIVFGEPAMVTTAYGRANPTDIDLDQFAKAKMSEEGEVHSPSDLIRKIREQKKA